MLLGGCIENALPFVEILKNRGCRKLILYFGSNNLLGNKIKGRPAQKPEEAVPLYINLVDKCVAKGLHVRICPLFGLEDKKDLVRIFNDDIRKEVGAKYNSTLVSVCSIRQARYERDIGNGDPNRDRDGIHPTVPGLRKLSCCFTF